MTLDAGNTEKLYVFKREADRMGVRIRPPSINKSGVDFTVVGGKIVYHGGASGREGSREP